MTYDIYNEAKTPWQLMPQDEQAAIIAAQKAGGVVERWSTYSVMWVLENFHPRVWVDSPRRIRPISMPTVDLSNPRGQALMFMTPEQQAGLRTLKAGEYEWLDSIGKWIEGTMCAIDPGRIYRQKPQTKPITVTVEAPGTYWIGADGEVEKCE